ncbi:tyrosine-type recombinase/integrase [Mesorhizobium sp. VK22B]|uniref:Tyrosine-type recombinase/integrase n=1 Tax=Mesorhizobium captivum TaxID=3072319 RepID=A0ABU4Z8R9_9HYPH|nr:tyrosine-type recombinase/integrase [Mesorhizobium sp. VK22B]MDX8494978.1 tyrosine-type recombinase/integrase [Mesorhizobium sp. VK22B]
MPYTKPRPRQKEENRAGKTKFKLNQKVVDGLKAPDPSGKQKLYWDGDTPGLAVQVSGSSFDKRYVVRVKTKDLEQVNVVLGKCALLSYEKARADALKLLAEITEGKIPKKRYRIGDKRNDTPDNMTLRQALAVHLAAGKRTKAARGKAFSPQTVEQYNTVLRLYLPDWADRPIASLTKDMCRARLRELGTTKSHSIANLALKLVSTVHGSAREVVPGLVENPIDGLIWYPEDQRTRTLQAKEMPGFYRAIMNIQDEVARDWFRLILYTGLRREESSSLRWSDISFEDRTITIPADRNKGKRIFMLPMSRQVEAILKNRWAKRLQARMILDTKDTFRYDFVFGRTGAGGNKTGHITSAETYLASVEKETGLHRSPHDFRRVFATACAKAGVNFSDLKCLMNHSRKGDVTMGYIIPDDDDIRIAAQRVADKMDELCKGRPAPANSNVAAHDNSVASR